MFKKRLIKNISRLVITATLALALTPAANTVSVLGGDIPSPPPEAQPLDFVLPPKTPL